MDLSKLLRVPAGPHIDTRYMTRGELFRSARQFLVIGAVAAVLLFATGVLADRVARRDTASPIFTALFVAFGMGAVGSLVASVWLSLIGLVRSSSYDPEAVREADQKRLEELGGGCQ